MSEHVLLTSVVLAFLIGVSGYGLWRILRAKAVDGVDPDSFQLDEQPLHFAPMTRLLDDADFEFLRIQPGYDASIELRLRARRAAICRRYLAELSAEFNRLHLALRLVSLSASVDRPDLARILVRQKLIFVWGITLTKVRIATFELGWNPVDVTGLVDAVESMRKLAQATNPAQTQAA